MPLVLNAIAPHASLLKNTLTQLAIFAVAAAPGYFVAALAFVPGIEKKILPFLLIYGLSYFFTESAPTPPPSFIRPRFSRRPHEPPDMASHPPRAKSENRRVFCL
jgi:hypothetical protein